MSRTAKVIIFSLVLLVAIINKQRRNDSSSSSNKEDYTSKNLNVKVENNNSKYYATTRPQNGYSPYNSYYGKGIYNNNTDNTIKVTAPVSSDIVFLLKNIYTGKTIRNEYIRGGSVFRLTGVPYGKYKFYYLHGKDWSANANFKGGLAKGNFLKNKSVGKSNKTFDCEFEEGYYGTYELTLQLRSNGNLTTVKSSENDL
jgi:hypothetical protein